MRAAVCAVLASALSVTVSAQQTINVTGAEVMEAGICTARVTSVISESRVVGGVIAEIDDFSLVQATTNIPARLGTRFGFRYRVHGTPTNAAVVLTIVGEHPPLKDPQTGKAQAKDIFQCDSLIGEGWVSYSFDNDWELIPGRWRISLWYEGRILCDKSFLVGVTEGPGLHNPQSP